jgi:hypothetical protein
LAGPGTACAQEDHTAAEQPASDGQGQGQAGPRPPPPLPGTAEQAGTLQAELADLKQENHDLKDRIRTLLRQRIQPKMSLDDGVKQVSPRKDASEFGSERAPSQRQLTAVFPVRRPLRPCWRPF